MCQVQVPSPKMLDNLGLPCGQVIRAQTGQHAQLIYLSIFEEVCKSSTQCRGVCVCMCMYTCKCLGRKFPAACPGDQEVGRGSLASMTRNPGGTKREQGDPREGSHLETPPDRTFWTERQSCWKGGRFYTSSIVRLSPSDQSW